MQHERTQQQLVQTTYREHMDFCQEELVEKVIRALVENRKLPLEGKFENQHIYVAGSTIRVGGYVHDGIVKLGTFFIPDR